MPADSAGDLDQLLRQQVDYYRAIAPEFEEHALPVAGGDEVATAVDAFRPCGRVLELACGPGTWTSRPLRHADQVTAVDSAPEMLEIASSRLAGEQVRFVQADLFTWEPDSRYDVVFFGFWLSHVPPERFESFWDLVARCLEPDGRVLFVDDGYRTPEELVEGEASTTIRRRRNDGIEHRIVKVPLEPDALERQLRALGWDVKVVPTSGPFFWGAGGPA